MNQQQKKTQNKAIKKEKICPFNSDLKCEDCRLWVEVPYGAGLMQCALILAAVK